MPCFDAQSAVQPSPQLGLLGVCGATLLIPQSKRPKADKTLLGFQTWLERAIRGHPEEVQVYLSPGKGTCQVRLLCNLGQQLHPELEHAATSSPQINPHVEGKYISL